MVLGGVGRPELGKSFRYPSRFQVVSDSNHEALMQETVSHVSGDGLVEELSPTEAARGLCVRTSENVQTRIHKQS